MITLRTLDGALKCAFRDFLREEWTAGSGATVSIPAGAKMYRKDRTYRY